MDTHVRQRLQALELAIVYGTQTVKTAKDELKEANQALSDAYEALREYARELTDPQKTPLFESVDTQTGEITTDDRTQDAEDR